LSIYSQHNSHQS